MIAGFGGLESAADFVSVGKTAAIIKQSMRNFKIKAKNFLFIENQNVNTRQKEKKIIICVSNKLYFLKNKTMIKFAMCIN